MSDAIDMEVELKKFEAELNKVDGDEQEPEPEPEVKEMKEEKTILQPKQDENKKVIEELRKQLKALQTEFDALLLVKKKYDAVLQRQMRMMEYMGKQAQKIGLRFDEMGY